MCRSMTANICSLLSCMCNLTSYLVDLRRWTMINNRLAVVSRPAAIFAPATEVALVLPAPALGTVRTSNFAVVHLH